MKHNTLIPVFLLLCSIAFAAPSGTYNVKSFGASGDGKSIDEVQGCHAGWNA